MLGLLILLILIGCVAAYWYLAKKYSPIIEAEELKSKQNINKQAKEILKDE